MMNDLDYTRAQIYYRRSTIVILENYRHLENCRENIGFNNISGFLRSSAVIQAKGG